MSTGPRRPPPTEIPDLDVAPLPTSRKRPMKAGPSPDFELELLPLGALELASPDSTAACAGADAGTDVPWPALTTGDETSAGPSDELVRACIPWGEPPTQVLSAVVYAFWVFRGKQQLARQFKAQSATTDELEQRRNAAVIEYVDSHRHLFEGDEKYALANSKLAEVEACANSATAQYQQSEALQSGTLQELEKRIETQRASIVRLTDAIAPQLARLKVLETERQRRQARRKRLDIDARSGQLGEVEHAHACEEEELAITQCAAEHASVRGEVARLEHDRQGLEFEVRRLEDESNAHARHLRTREAASRAQLRPALAAATDAKLALVRTAVAHRDRKRVTDSVRLELIALEEPLAAARLRLAALALAEHAFERRRVKQGLQLLIACVALLLLPILLRILA